MKEQVIQQAFGDLKSKWTNWKTYRIYIFLFSNRILFFTMAIFILLVGLLSLFGFFGPKEYQALVGGVCTLICFFILSLFFAPVFGLYQVLPNIKSEFFEHLKAFLKIRNFKYKADGEAFTKDFLKSKLYPYKLTKIRGRDFFSGFSGYFPFLIWNAWGWFQERSFQSPMTFASVNTSYIGFAGDQVIFRNIKPNTGDLIVFSKKGEEYYGDLMQSFKSDPKFKQTGFSDEVLTKNLIAFRTASFGGLTSRIFHSIMEILHLFPGGAAFHFSPEVIFVNVPHEEKWLQGNPFESPDRILLGNVHRFFRLMLIPGILEKGITGSNQD